MTTPLSWNLHGNDQLSALLEKLDRTVSRLDRTMQGAARDARDYGRALGSAETPGKRLQATTTETGRRFDFFREKIIAAVMWLRTMAITATVALGSAAVAAATFGIRLAAANEEAAISFELMLGSAAKAKAFLGKLQQFAAATPFEMPQLRTAASRLLAVGTNAKDIIPLLTSLGDATAGMGTGAFGIERAVTALTQMRQKTKVTGEEMMQLTEAGIPAWETLATKLKVDVAKAMDMVQKRQVDASVIFDAIRERQGKGMQRLAGMMQRQSLTLTGLWSTFKDNAGQALATFAEPAIPAIKKVLDFASKAVPGFLNSVRSGAKQIGGIFKGSDVPERLRTALRELGEKVLPKLREAWDKIVKTVRDNKEGLEKLGRFIADIIIPIFGAQLLTSIDMITFAFQAVITVAGLVVDAIKFMTQVTLNNLGFLVHGAAAAFGWVPGLGPKLKEAAAKFDEFARHIMGKFDEIDGRTVDVWVNVHERGARGEHGGSGVGTGSTLITFNDRAGGPSRHAKGGVDSPGWNLYGEEGPELHFQPGGGRTLTAAQTRQAMGDGVLGVLRVVHEKPDGTVIREELLTLKRRRGGVALGLG